MTPTVGSAGQFEFQVACLGGKQDPSWDYRFTGNLDAWRVGPEIFGTLVELFASAPSLIEQWKNIPDHSMAWWRFNVEWMDLLLSPFPAGTRWPTRLSLQVYLSDPTVTGSPHPAYANYVGEIHYVCRGFVCDVEDAISFANELGQELREIGCLRG